MVKYMGLGVLTVLRIILIIEYMGLESQQSSLQDHTDESTWEWNLNSLQDHKMMEYMGLGVLTVFRIILMMQYMGLESQVIRITLVMEYMGLESQVFRFTLVTGVHGTGNLNSLQGHTGDRVHGIGNRNSLQDHIGGLGI